MLKISFAFSPATEDPKSVSEFPEAKSANERLTISSCTIPSITQRGFVSPNIEEEPRTTIFELFQKYHLRSAQ